MKKVLIPFIALFVFAFTSCECEKDYISIDAGINCTEDLLNYVEPMFSVYVNGSFVKDHRLSKSDFKQGQITYTLNNDTSIVFEAIRNVYNEENVNSADVIVVTTFYPIETPEYQQRAYLDYSPILGVSAKIDNETYYIRSSESLSFAHTTNVQQYINHLVTISDTTHCIVKSSGEIIIKR